MASKIAAQVHAVAVGQIEIEHRELHGIDRHSGSRLGAGAGNKDTFSHRRDVLPQQFADVDFVLDDDGHLDERAPSGQYIECRRLHARCLGNGPGIGIGPFPRPDYYAMLRSCSVQPLSVLDRLDREPHRAGR